MDYCFVGNFERINQNQNFVFIPAPESLGPPYLRLHRIQLPGDFQMKDEDIDDTTIDAVEGELHESEGQANSTRPRGKREPVICNVCCKTFLDKSILRRHIRTVHEKQKDFICYVCNRQFSQLGNLKIHISTVHLDYRLSLIHI